MCLETLEGVESIGGFKVKIQPEDKHPGDLFPQTIVVNTSSNTLCFKLQNGPIKEVGVNGCQIETVIEAAKIIIERLNQKFPCYENVRAMEGLKDALVALADRKAKREARGVEGKSEL